MKNKYEIQETDYGVTWINVLQKNSRGETIKICITECKNRGGKHALPVLWYQAGYTKKATYPFEDFVALVTNGNGKFDGSQLNRALRTEDGEVYDIIAGNFLVVGLGSEDFAWSEYPCSRKSYSTDCSL